MSPWARRAGGFAAGGGGVACGSFVLTEMLITRCQSFQNRSRMQSHELARLQRPRRESPIGFRERRIRTRDRWAPQ